MSSLEDWRLLLKPRINIFHFLSKENKIIFTGHFLSFYLDPNPDSLKSLDPDPNTIHIDPHQDW